MRGDFNMISDINRIIVFGDSFMDSGNYRSFAEARGVRNGGRFSTNPDPMWIEHVAQGLGLELRPSADGGTNHAEGFSMVALPAPPVPGLETMPLTCKPVQQQVRDFIVTHNFQSSDLIVLNGGGNDVLASVMTGSGLPSLQAAARALAETVQLIAQSGGSHIAIPETPDLGTTPIGGSGKGDDQNPVSQAVQAFNTQVTQALEAMNLRSFIIPSFDFTRQMFRQPQQFGFLETQTPVYADSGLAAFLFDDTAQVTKQASETHLFADMIHLSGKGHRLYGAHALTHLRGWLKV
jgi:outer membrane lipase/esterase